MKKTPSIELISMIDTRKLAWENSRPTFRHGDMKMESALGMDMAFNSLCMISFKINSSMYFRDFLFAIRPLYAWAMSSRDIEFNKDNLKLSAECFWGERQIEETLDLTAQGLHQNICRQKLPMTLSTTYVINMDFRTVCGLIKTMKLLDEDLYSVYGTLFEKAICKVEGYEGNQVKEFSESYLIKDTRKDYSCTRGKTNGFVYGRKFLNVALASQFLRQSQAKIKIGLWNDISQDGYFSSANITQSDDMQVEWHIPDSTYHSLMRNRSHWFADWRNNMWGELIGDYTKNMTISEFWEFIPSGGGRPDPYHYHTLKRINGDDLNSPCPIAIEKVQLIKDRIEDQGHNPVVDKYWELFEKGFIKNNPENEKRVAYEEMLNAKKSK